MTTNTERKRYIIAGAVLLVLIALGAFLVNALQPWTWHYYTDDIALRSLARDVTPRLVLWEKAAELPVQMELPAGCAEPAISPDGAQMVFTRISTNGNADLFIARWDGAVWGKPLPIRALNSKFNETGASFSDDGQLLFFSSDRPGGLGGYDVWVVRWDGMEYAWPQPLTLMVNSKFDEFCARSSGSDSRLYYSSNRPKGPLTKEDEGLSLKDLRKKWAGGDWDIYAADRIPVGFTNSTVERAMSIMYSLRNSALTDPAVMEKLGGSKQTEDAVNRGLAFLAQNQNTNGSWSAASSEHDVAATAFALLAFLGRGERHDKPCTYQKTVAAGLAWLLAQQNKLTGDIRGRGNMYNQGIGTLALVEAYGVTRDRDVFDAAQSAIYFNVDAQNAEDGGWRYRPQEAGDLSVSGWVIMGLRSAELSGLHVPSKTRAGINKFLKKVSFGENGGAFSYQGGGRGTDAMQATGFFCSQLMGLPASTPKAFEAVKNLQKNKGEIKFSDLYFAYYGTLCSYQNQGPQWRNWKAAMNEEFLGAQLGNGSWAVGGQHSQNMGPSIATALVTLCLQAHYRYVPLFGLGYEPPAYPVAGAVMSEDQLPSVPEYDRARPMEALNSGADDLYAVPTRHGDFVYLVSNRQGGEGGFDIYRARTAGGGNLLPENLGPAINSPSDDTAPALRAAGFALVFSSTRGLQPDRHRLYSSVSRVVLPQHQYGAMPAWDWLWDNYFATMLIICLALVTLIVWVVVMVYNQRRRRSVP